MFDVLGRAIADHRERTVVLFLLAVLAFVAIGLSLFSRFDSGSCSDPDSGSVKVAEYLESTVKTTDYVAFGTFCSSGVTSVKMLGTGSEY